MAGIGFELRKIYGRKTLVSNLWGTVYATMTTIGPAVLSAVLMLLMKALLDLVGMTDFESRLFVSATTYVFVIAMIVSVVFSAPVSRYISDCVYLKKESDICPSMFGTLTLSSLVAALVMLALCAGIYYSADDISLTFIVVYYLLGVLVTDAYTMMTYASALKHYRAMTLGFAIGFILAVCTFFFIHESIDMNSVTAACISLAVCFFVVTLVLIFQCMRAFGVPKGKFFAFMGYFPRYPKLVVGSFAYTLGLYAPTLIYWLFSPRAETVSIFQTFPTYDLAFFMAIVVNMPALVIFVVKVETAFYDKYALYISALNKGTMDQIERDRGIMIKTLKYQLLFVYQVQFIITLMLVCLANVFFPYLGMGAEILQMFTIASFAVYVVFCMYFTIIVFYYFSDYTSACISSIAFLGVTAVFAVVALLVDGLYAVPLLVGGLVGWTIAIALLVHRMQNLDSFLMCDN